MMIEAATYKIILRMVIAVISNWGDFGPNHLSPKKLWQYIVQNSARLPCRASSKKYFKVGTRCCTSLTQMYARYKTVFKNVYSRSDGKYDIKP